MYLLDEILELARSSPEQAQAVADAIERKLANRSPVIKFKVQGGCLARGGEHFVQVLQRWRLAPVAAVVALKPPALQVSR